MNPEGIDKGFLKLFRNFRGHSFWKQRRKFSFAEAWIDLLFRATHVEAEKLRGFEKVKLLPGDILTSQEKLAIAWNWDRGRVKRFLNLLKNEHAVNIKATNKYTKISICNHKVYADWRTTKDPTNDQRVNIKRPTSDHIIEVKDLKDLKNKENILSQISELRSQFPTHFRIQLDNFLELCKLNNKTQKISDGKIFSILKNLLETFQSYPDTFENALDITVGKEVGNPEYVRAVAKNHNEEGYGNTQQSTKPKPKEIHYLNDDPIPTPEEEAAERKKSWDNMDPVFKQAMKVERDKILTAKGELFMQPPSPMDDLLGD